MTAHPRPYGRVREGGCPWRARLAVGVALGICAAHHGNLITLAASLAWTWNAAVRWQRDRPKDPLPPDTASQPCAPTLDPLETCHGPGGPPVTALRRYWWLWRHTPNTSTGPH